MHESATIMKLESLPDEILMQCLNYLNASDIFYACDQLNDRLSRLIRSLSLCFTFQNVPQIWFNEFSKNVLMDPNVRSHTYSLYISNKSKANQIQMFLSNFRFTEFSRLRFISLNGLYEYIVVKLIQMIPDLPCLRYFHLTKYTCEPSQLLHSIASSSVKTLSIPSLRLSDLSSVNQFISITNLILVQCYIEELCQFVKYFPMLQKLNIKELRQCITSREFKSRPNDTNVAIHVRQIVIDYSIVRFDILELYLKKMSNLTFLSLCVYGNIELIDAYRWKQLIIDSLLKLETFKFVFNVPLKSELDSIDRIQGFENEFWRRKYRCHINYEIVNNRILVYTEPYTSNCYTLRKSAKNYVKNRIHNYDMYIYVTNLVLYVEALSDRYQDYFPNVKSLTLTSYCNGRYHICRQITSKDLQYLKKIVNLNKLINLEIIMLCRWESSSVLLQFLKWTPHISSLTMSDNDLYHLLTDRELCQYLKKMIKTLKFKNLQPTALNDTCKIVRVFQVFSNIEQLRCDLNDQVDVLFLFNTLAELTNLQVFLYDGDFINISNDDSMEIDRFSFTIKKEEPINMVQNTLAYQCLKYDV